MNGRELETDPCAQNAAELWAIPGGVHVIVAVLHRG
jgi:hypothetical protein